MAPAGASVIIQIEKLLQCPGPMLLYSGSKLSSVQAPKLSNQETQASSPTVKGSSRKPSFTSSKIPDPGYKRTSSGSGDPATRTNEFFG